MRRAPFLLLALLAAGLAQTAQARVTRFVVEERVPLAPGTLFGQAGAYERLTGTAYLEVDPLDPRDRGIVDLDKAPRNAGGRVEFSSPFVIVKPVEMARGNRKIWYGLNNRGNCFELQFRSFPAGVWTCKPQTLEDIGGADNVLLDEGYTWVDAGWSGDGIMPPDRSQIFPTFPVAHNPDGSAIVGPNRLEFQPAAAAFTQPFVAGWRPYAAATLDTTRATLTVRDHEGDPRTPIAPDRWAFGTCPQGPASLQPTATDLCLFEGFQPGRIYELVYLARDPVVMGLAYAVTRDIASFLRQRTQDDAGNPNPLTAGGVAIRRAYLSGTSSTGMYMRDFLYLGFNEDEDGRQVFDGVTVYSGGTNKLFANTRFAHPTFYSGQDQHHDYVSSAVAPFTFGVTRDPVSGAVDGILKRPATDPRVIEVDEELTFWQWRASLNVVNAAGRDIAPPPNVRLYMQNGFGHIGAVGLLAPPQDAGACRHTTQGITALPVTLRALVGIMDDWADRGIEPPPSRYPSRDEGSLVTLAEYRHRFPAIPGLEPPAVLNRLELMDFGPGFGAEGGVQSVLPPLLDMRGRLGLRYHLFVPRPQADGDGAGGIDTIWTRAPLGTNVGWNRGTGLHADDLCGLSGSYVLFATTRAERLAQRDSRPSLEERYRTHQGFVEAVRRAATGLVHERFLLKQDAQAFIRAAEESDVLR